jgi:hypothetical protein
MDNNSLNLVRGCLLIPYLFLYFTIGLVIVAPLSFISFVFYMAVFGAFFMWQIKEFMDYAFQEEVKSITKEMRRNVHEI